MNGIFWQRCVLDDAREGYRRKVAMSFLFVVAVRNSLVDREEEWQRIDDAQSDRAIVSLLLWGEVNP